MAQDRSRSIHTIEERPPDQRKKRMDAVAEEFVEFIEHLIQTMDHPVDEGDVIDVETCPTELLRHLDEPKRPSGVRTKVSPPPPPPKSSIEDLSFESDFDLLEDSLIDTEKIDQE